MGASGRLPASALAALGLTLLVSTFPALLLLSVSHVCAHCFSLLCVVRIYLSHGDGSTQEQGRLLCSLDTHILEPSDRQQTQGGGPPRGVLWWGKHGAGVLTQGLRRAPWKRCGWAE